MFHRYAISFWVCLASTAASATPLPAAPPTAEEAPKESVASRKHAKPALGVELYAVNTHETFHLRPDAQGRFTDAVLRGWNRFLRCHHTGRIGQMSTRLAKLIYDVDRHFDFKRVYVIAGYRAARVAAQKGNPHSPHKKGLACDFRIEGVTNTALRDYERTLSKVGVGYYPNSDFVHLDVRDQRSAYWVDLSSPGQRAIYVKPLPILPTVEQNSETEAEPDEEVVAPEVPAFAATEEAQTVHFHSMGRRSPSRSHITEYVVGGE